MTPGVVPELYVSDLRRSLLFYVDGLGFEVAYDRPEEKFAAITLSESVVMLEETARHTTSSDEEFETGQWRTADLDFAFGRGVSFQVTVPDVIAVHARVVDGGYKVKLGLCEKTYRVGEDVVRLRQFLVMDPDGYLVRPAQPIDADNAMPGRGTVR